MKKRIVLAGIAGAALFVPALAMAAGATGAVQGGVSGTGIAPVQAPGTGPNGTAIPDIPAGGTTSGINSSQDTTGSIDTSKQGGAAVTDLQQKLSAKGYTDIQPQNASGMNTSGKTRFTARNAAGKKVIVTVNANTGAVIGEKAMD